MTKQTKTLLTVAILGVGGYMLYKNFKKPATATAFTGKQYTGQVGSRQKHYVGNSVGKRQKNLTNTLNIQDSGWVRADGGANGAPSKFFGVKSSGWVRMAGM